MPRKDTEETGETSWPVSLSRRALIFGSAGVASLIALGYADILSASSAVAIDMRLMHPFNNPDLADGFGSLTGRTYPHTGLDYPQPDGTAIPAIGNGQIVRNTWNGGNGWCVSQSLEDGHYVSYIHQSVQSPLPVGTYVSIGQLIGYVGDTGSNSRGSHLHISVSDIPDVYLGLGTLIDPNAFINNHLNGDSGLSQAEVNAINANTNQQFTTLTELVNVVADRLRREARARAFKNTATGEWALVQWSTGTVLGPTNNRAVVDVWATAFLVASPTDVDRAVELDAASFTQMLATAASIRNQIK